MLKTVKTTVRNLIWPYRQITSGLRSLPDFIIIGAQKSGTSSLFYYLKQHPQILPSFKKEVHFFDGGLDRSVDNYKKGKEWYCAHFPLRICVKGHLKTGEASPLYIFNPLAPKRIFGLIPKVRLIAILRNPTERAVSHYFHVRRKGGEQLHMIDAFREEDNRLKSVLQNKDFKNPILKNFSYKSRGLYKQQLERYLEYFHWDQILVINSENFFKEPNTTLRRVFDFLEIDKEFKVKNLKPRHVATNREKVAPEVYEYLDGFFLPHNQALYELLNKSFDW